MVEVCGWVVLGFATFSTALFLWNLLLFRTAPPLPIQSYDWPAVSVLIPARDEARTILETLRAVLANQESQFEVVVLDDQSQDNTVQIVSDIAAGDSRVRLIHGASLPPGWCGKQYACFQLAEHASYDELLFIDADVVVAPDAIRRCLMQREVTGVDLLSGFPRQRVGTFGEALLIPLMHIVLLTYLPLRHMRRSTSPAAAAGCGQLFLTSLKAYQQAGGHAAIKASLHDGLTLPRAYRRAGLTTDIFDARDLATCRMYQGWSQTCAGLLKNAHEGIANPRLIVPATSLMFMNYVAPTVFLMFQLARPESVQVTALAWVAAGVSFVPRMLAAARFDGTWLATAVFPMSIVLFIGLQWLAFGRRLFGWQSRWRGRAYHAETD